MISHMNISISYVFRAELLFCKTTHGHTVRWFLQLSMEMNTSMAPSLEWDQTLTYCFLTMPPSR